MARECLWALAALLSLAATPALAAGCKSQGAVDTPISFPKNDSGDVPFARSMAGVMLPAVSGTLPHALTCTRATLRTALGDYVIGGEDGDAFPRMALRADGKAGPVAYLAASPEMPGIFALVVHSPGKRTVVTRFYAGVPTDQRFADDLRASLAEETGIMSYDAKRNLVRYAFNVAAVPPPAPTGSREGGRKVAAGPQILIPESGDPRLLDVNAGMRHRPSGFACPSTFAGLAVLLMMVDPRENSLACNYRAGTDPQYRQDDAIRYQVALIKARFGDTPRGVFDRLSAQGRAALDIKGDHIPPLATGPAPAPALAVFWDTEDAGVQGLWVGKSGGWIVYLRAQYPASPANDVEAGKVAQTLFALIARQVK